MPTYEYLCRACGDRREVVQAFSDDPLTVCEACGGELRKVFSAAGLIFKGSGWHVKDYSSGSSKPGASQSSGESSGSGEGTKDSSSATAASPPAASTPSTPSATAKGD